MFCGEIVWPYPIFVLSTICINYFEEIWLVVETGPFDGFAAINETKKSERFSTCIKNFNTSEENIKCSQFKNAKTNLHLYMSCFISFRDLQ